VSYNDIIDHVIISNEMKCSYMAGSAAILTDAAATIASYGNTTTDHYPVFTRYLFAPPLSASVNYTGSPYCTTTGTALPTVTGSTTGVYSSTAGLVINATTGEINLATSTLGNYVVTYTVAASGACASGFNTTANVVIGNVSTVPTSITASSTLICNATGGATNLATVGGNLANGAAYKWYTGSCGGTLIGTGNSLTNVPVNAGANTYYVRAEGVCNTTACASVIVNASLQPTVSTTINPTTGVTPETPVTVTATVLPAGTYTYQWYKNDVLITANTASIIVPAHEAGNYKVKAIATSGCEILSVSTLISSAVSPILYITPNPNNGVFNVSFNNGQTNLGGRTLTLFDSKGARVFNQTYTNSVPYSYMKVDISKYAKGTYFVVLRDATGKRLASGKVAVQ
jgi:Ig-like domain CHU_C associated/Secretion system C-terminal sorting domain